MAGRSRRWKAQTIFSAAWDSGIHIPRLCHIGGLSDPGACRLCLVEVEGQQKLRASCLTEAAEGMVVRTDTPRCGRNANSSSSCCSPSAITSAPSA